VAVCVRRVPALQATKQRTGRQQADARSECGNHGRSTMATAQRHQGDSETSQANAACHSRHILPIVFLHMSTRAYRLRFAQWCLPVAGMKWCKVGRGVGGFCAVLERGSERCSSHGRSSFTARTMRFRWHVVGRLPYTGDFHRRNENTER